MDKSIQTLLDILKVTLTNKQVAFNIEDEKQLYIIAKENGLSGSIYETVKDHLTDKDIKSRFRKDFLKYVSDDEKKLNLINKISSLFDENEIDHLYLKGSSLKEAYPKTYMRSMGDIDVLVKENDFDKANAVLKSNGFTIDSQGPVHNVFFYGEIEVELHKKLIKEEEKSQFSCLANIWDHVQIVNQTNWTMETEYEMIYLLYHIRKHLLSSGVGLRNILDIGMYLNHFLFSDKNLLETELLNTELSILYTNMILFNERYLDLNLNQFYVKNKEINMDFDDELYEKFTEYIIRSGVHGLGYGFNQFVARFAKDEKDQIGKRKSFIRFLFPSFAFMKEKYPKMMKYRIMLPLGWIRRFFDLIFKKTRNILIYLHLIKNADKKEIRETKDLFVRMGL